MKLFSRRKAAHTPQSIPAIKYVNLVLLDAIRKGKPELVIRESDVLPTLAELYCDSDLADFPHANLPPPSFSVIANRLKVMSGCTPMRHQTPISGVIHLNADGVEHVLKAQFDDTVEDPFCTVTIDKDSSPSGLRSPTQ